MDATRIVSVVVPAFNRFVRLRRCDVTSTTSDRTSAARSTPQITADVAFGSSIRDRLRIATKAERVIEVERQDQGTEAAPKSIRTQVRSRIRVADE